MSAAPKRQIDYDHELTLKQNIKRARKQLDISAQDIMSATGISKASVDAYIAYNLKSQNGNDTPTSLALRGYISTLFVGGLPDVIITENTHTEDLYELFGCSKCRYRMKSQPGCYKFSIIKAEINAGTYIHTIKYGSFRLSHTRKCPYTHAYQNERRHRVPDTLRHTQKRRSEK